MHFHALQLILLAIFITFKLLVLDDSWSISLVEWGRIFYQCSLYIYMFCSPLLNCVIAILFK